MYTCQLYPVNPTQHSQAEDITVSRVPSLDVCHTVVSHNARIYNNTVIFHIWYSLYMSYSIFSTTLER